MILGNAIAGPRTATIRQHADAYVQHGPISVEELMMSLLQLSDAWNPVIKHIEANATAAQSELIPRKPGSITWTIAQQNAAQPYTAADVLPQLTSLQTLNVQLHHLPEGFFASLPPSLVTLRLQLPAPLCAYELAAAVAGLRTLPNLRSVALPHYASTAADAALRGSLPPGCLLEISP